MTDHQRPEALRAQFEQHMLDNGWSDGELDWRGSHHAYLDIQDAWKLYQAGHAAAKAETADVGSGKPNRRKSGIARPARPSWRGGATMLGGWKDSGTS